MGTKKKDSAPSVRIAAAELVTLRIDDLIPYAKNAKLHTPEQIKTLRASLRKFGFVAPVLIDERNNVLAGHGRLAAAKAEGMTTVPCVRVPGLTDEERRAYVLADNRLTELGGWDEEMLRVELQDLDAIGFDLGVIGFDLDFSPAAPEVSPKMIDGFNPEDVETEETEEYRDFTEKFLPKKTTDDCYTPPCVYDVVRDWACRNYGKDPAAIVRPFFPGGDYEHYSYPYGCFVLDNPPFSILSDIIQFYFSRKIDFFLFAPTLTLLAARNCLDVAHLCTGATIVYQNGATVPTSFVTNCEPGVVLRTAPDLGQAIESAQDANKPAKELPNYFYPNSVITAALCQRYAKRGVEFCVRRGDCVRISALDAQKEIGASIFGGGLLLSERAAAERAAAERAAAERAAAERAAAERAAAERAAATTWTLSQRELEIVRSLRGGNPDGGDCL